MLKNSRRLREFFSTLLMGRSCPRGAVWVGPLNLVVHVGVPLPFQASPKAGRAIGSAARGMLTAGWVELP